MNNYRICFVDFGPWGAFLPGGHLSTDLWQDHGLGLLRTAANQAGWETFVLSTKNYGSAIDIVKDLKCFDLLIMNVRTYNLIQALEISTLFKRENKQGKVLAGGMHALVSLEEMKAHSDFDHICVNGSHETLIEILNTLSTADRIIYGSPPKPMDSWPIIDRHFWPKPLNANINWPLEDSMPGWPPGPIATIITSRVCPWRCSFCNESSYIQQQKRRSVDSVIDELNHIYDTTGEFNSIVIHDSMFFQNPLWLKEWLEKYPLRARKVWPYWAAARADTVRKWPELFKDLVLKTNWTLVSIGLESGSDNTLLTLNKECTVQDNLFSIKLINELGDHLESIGSPPVKIFSNIMWGVPGESMEDMYGTIRMVSLIKRPLLSYSHYAPYPGGALGYQLIAEGKSLLNTGQLDRNPNSNKTTCVDYDIVNKAMQGLFNHDALNDIEAWILRHTNNHQIEKLENFHPRQDIYKFTQPDGSIKISWGSSIQIAIQALSNRLGADELEAIDFSNPEKIDQKTLPAIVDRLK
jgi:anaerobic magnesium-protoporphyrin IX monomethyl ester cyclase